MAKPPLIMNILVFDASKGDDAEVEQDLVVNISDTASRLWLSNFVAWAMHDNKILEMYPAPGRKPNFVAKMKG